MPDPVAQKNARARANALAHQHRPPGKTARHLIEAITFAAIPHFIACACGWKAHAMTHPQIEREWNDHRSDMRAAGEVPRK